MTAGAGGQVYSTGFDDKLGEADPAAGYMSVVFFVPRLSIFIVHPFFFLE